MLRSKCAPVLSEGIKDVLNLALTEIGRCVKDVEQIETEVKDTNADKFDVGDEKSFLSQRVRMFLRELKNSEDLRSRNYKERTNIIEEILKIPLVTKNIESDLRLEPLIKKLARHAKSRMVEDINMKVMDAECRDTTTWVVMLFRAMIEFAWKMSIYERDEEGGEEEDIASEWIVNILNSCGVPAHCLDLIAPGMDPTLMLESMKLLVAMLYKEGGNLKVQTSINQHLNNSHGSLHFFTVLRASIKSLMILSEEKALPDTAIAEPKIALQLMQLMSEGHYEPNQAIVREQKMNPISMNLLDELVVLFNNCTDFTTNDQSVHEPSLQASVSCSSVILEVIQGPCRDNQIYFALNTPLLESINRILNNLQPYLLPNRDVADSDAELIEEMILQIFAIVEALLETQSRDSVITDRILSVINFETVVCLADPKKPYDMGQGHSDSLKQSEDITNAAMVLLATLCDARPSLHEEIRLKKRIKEKMHENIVSIEIVWKFRNESGKEENSLMRRFFPVPKICRHLSEVTKAKIIESIPLDSQDAKLQAFIREARNVYNEVNHHEHLSSVKWGGINMAQFFSRRNQEISTWLAFATAFIINMTMVFTMRQGDSVGTYVYNPPMIKNVVKALNIMNVSLSIFTLLLYILVRCPVLYERQMDKFRSNTEHHGGNYEFRSIMRTCSDPIMLYYFGYTLLSFLGIWYFQVLPFLLLDIIMKGSTTRDVVRSVVNNFKQLGATMLLGVFVIVIFSNLIFILFPHDFVEEQGDVQNMGRSAACATLWSCFKVTSNLGLRQSGGIGDVMSNNIQDRVWLDISFFLIVKIVLLNIILGIIIDTFSKLRVDKQEREDKTRNNCLICGIDRLTFHNVKNEVTAFSNHIKEHHHVWNYLYFIFYIWGQDKDDDDGLELYVRKLVHDIDVSWFPSGRAITLDSQPKQRDQGVVQDLVMIKKTIENVIISNFHETNQAVGNTGKYLEQILDRVHLTLTNIKPKITTPKLPPSFDSKDQIYDNTDNSTNRKESEPQVLWLVKE